MCTSVFVCSIYIDNPPLALESAPAMPSLVGAPHASQSHHRVRFGACHAYPRPPAPNHIISPAPPLIDRAPSAFNTSVHACDTLPHTRKCQHTYPLPKQHARLCFRLYHRSARRRRCPPPRRNALSVFPSQMAPTKTLPVRGHFLAVHVDVDREIYPE